MPPNTSSPVENSDCSPENRMILKRPPPSKFRSENSESPKKILLYDGNYYDVTTWVDRHPGGKVIEYYTESGEDATLAIQQFHYRAKSRVMGLMKNFKIVGSTAGPPQRQNSQNGDTHCTTMERHARLTEDFTKLYLELEAEGLFQPSWSHLVYRIFEILVLAVLGIYLMNLGRESLSLQVLGIFVFSLFFGRCAWLQHEGGHRSLTGNRKIDWLLQTISFGVGIGMASSWWSNQHNKHHSMPQRLQHDVDLKTLPLLAFNAKVLDEDNEKRKKDHNNNSKIEKGKRKNFFILNQAFLFLTVDTMLVALIWKFWLHPRYSIFKKKYPELLSMILHYCIMFYFIDFWPYILSTWLGSIYLFGNFSLSHTHLPVTNSQLHWLEYGLLHTQDIDSKWWPSLCDWWMGYLNCQIEHHLFPTMPQFRNRQVKSRVKALGQKHGIPYLCTSYGEAVVKTFSNLHQVANHHKNV